VEVAEGLDPLVQSALEDPRVMLVPPDLRGLRVMRGNADQKALEVFRVPLDLLAVELEEPLYLAPKDLEVLLALLDLRGNKESRVLPDLRAITDFLAQPEQTVNLDLRAIMVQLDPLVLLDRRVLPDLLESVVPPVRMRLPHSSTDISLRMRRPRHTARRLTSKTHFAKPTRSRTVPGTILR
jgi:hypothetical protein